MGLKICINHKGIEEFISLELAMITATAIFCEVLKLGKLMECISVT